MSAKHTPGPWTVDRIDYPRGLDVSLEVVRVRDRKLVAQTIMREARTESALLAEDEANARLIAAAPELLQACMAFAEWYEVDSTEQKRDDAFCAAKAAIAKAEGK